MSTTLMVLFANVHRKSVDPNVKVRYIHFLYLPLIKYHMSRKIMSEANSLFRFNLFFSNTVNEEAESLSTPGKNEYNSYEPI